MKFVAKTSMGNEIFFEPRQVLGGSGKIPNPIEYYIAAIGGCAAIKTQIDLTALGMAPKSVSVSVGCARSEALTTIHVTFTLAGKFDNAKLAEVINDVMTLHCPVGVMAANAELFLPGFMSR